MDAATAGQATVISTHSAIKEPPRPNTKLSGPPRGNLAFAKTLEGQVRCSVWLASVQVDTCPTVDRRSNERLIDCLALIGSALGGVSLLSQPDPFHRLRRGIGQSCSKRGCPQDWQTRSFLGSPANREQLQPNSQHAPGGRFLNASSMRRALSARSSSCFLQSSFQSLFHRSNISANKSSSLGMENPPSSNSRSGNCHPLGVLHANYLLVCAGRKLSQPRPSRDSLRRAQAITTP
jgi:hypothetical protein